MGCHKCHRRNCTGGPDCGSSNITRENNFSNTSEGRDGEDAYLAYVRVTEAKGEIPFSYEEWALLNESNVYEEDNW